MGTADNSTLSPRQKWAALTFHKCLPESFKGKTVDTMKAVDVYELDQAFDKLIAKVGKDGLMKQPKTKLRKGEQA